jgi:hypothetical protein
MNPCPELARRMRRFSQNPLARQIANVLSNWLQMCLAGNYCDGDTCFTATLMFRYISPIQKRTGTFISCRGGISHYLMHNKATLTLGEP